MPNMFQRAWAAGVMAIPIAQLCDLGESELPALWASIANQSPLKFVICVSSDELVGAELRATLLHILASLGLKAADCAVVADFAGAELSDPMIAAPTIGGALDTLQEIGARRYIMFQGTH